MKKFASAFLALGLIGLSAHASSSGDAMNSFLSSKIRDKSVRAVLCQWNDEVAVTDGDVLELKQKLMELIPQMGIAALQDLKGLTAQSLLVTGSPSCEYTNVPKSFGIAVRGGLSMRVFITNETGRENYRIALTSLKNDKVAQIYKGAAPLVQMGLGTVAMDNLVKQISEQVVAVSERPLRMQLEDINGVKAIDIIFSDIAEAGSMHSLVLMEDGLLMASNQLNVTLGSHSGAAVSEASQAVTYEVTAVARCLCNASMVVKGSDGQSGYVLNTQKVDSIKIGVQGKALTLQNPPDGIRKYFSGAETDAWVIAELAKQGIQLTAKDEVDLLSFTGTITLYDDYNGKTQLP